MKTYPKPANAAMIFTLLGVTIGAVVVALATPKTGREVRNAIKSAARRLGGGAGEPDEDPEKIEAAFI